MKRSAAVESLLLVRGQIRIMAAKPDNRSRTRLPVMVLCDIRIGDLPPEPVRIRDMTQDGLKIAVKRALLAGDRVRILMPGMAEWRLARVAWCANHCAGLAFAGPTNNWAVMDEYPQQRLSRACKWPPPIDAH